MSERIWSPIGWFALITALLVSGVSGGLQANTARASPIEDCLNAPKSPAPQGRHWYYRIDRAKLRKCWYLGALDQPVHHAAAQTVPRAAPGTHLKRDGCHRGPLAGSGKVPGEGNDLKKFL